MSRINLYFTVFVTLIFVISTASGNPRLLKRQSYNNGYQRQGMQSQYGMGGMNSGMGMMGQGPVMGLQAKQQQEFDAIINNDLQSLKSMKESLKKFGDSLPDSQEDQVDDFVKRFEKLVKTKPRNLSRQAEDAYKQGKKIVDNNDITVAEMKQQLMMFQQSLDPQTRNEITQVMMQQMNEIVPELQQYIRMY